MPSDSALRERKTVSIAARNVKAASAEAADIEMPSKKEAGGGKGAGKDKQEYWGGDSTVFESRDDD
jgi:hypothetical protein